MAFNWENIPAKLLFTERAPVDAIFVELFLHKNKWLLCCAYNTNKNSISNDLDLLRKTLNLLPANYELFLTLDFNVEFNRTCQNAFYDFYSLKSFFKKPT